MVAKAAEKSRVLVFDATAFYAGILSGGVVKGWTTPKVVDEVSHNKLRGATIEGALAAGILEVREASSMWAKKVADMASESGDLPALSEADLSVLALAAELKEEHHVVVVVSDDYAVVNVAKMLGLDHRAGKKGFRLVKWLWYCSGCGKTFRGRVKNVCDVCGSKVKRKPV